MNRRRVIAAVTLALVGTGAIALDVADRDENTKVTTARNPRASSTTALLLPTTSRSTSTTVRTPTAGRRTAAASM